MSGPGGKSDCPGEDAQWEIVDWEIVDWRNRAMKDGRGSNAGFAGMGDGEKIILTIEYRNSPMPLRKL
jgi:hypothetical protein